MDDATGAIPPPRPDAPRPNTGPSRATPSPAKRSGFDAEVKAALLAEVARGQAETAYHLAYVHSLDQSIAWLEAVDVVAGFALGPAYDTGQVIGYTAMGEQEGAADALLSLVLFKAGTAKRFADTATVRHFDAIQEDLPSTIKDAIDIINAAEGIADVIR